MKLKAQEIFVTLNERGKTFGATPSWLKSFCQRCDIRGLVSMEGSNKRRSKADDKENVYWVNLGLNVKENVAEPAEH